MCYDIIVSKKNTADRKEYSNERTNYVGSSHIPNIEKNEKLENKFNSVQYVLDDQLKSSFTIMRSKDEIKKNVDTLENITKKAINLRSKSEHTIYDLRFASALRQNIR